LCSTAIDTAKVGKPCRKFVVPSSGSMIQTNSLSPLRPAFLAENGVLGVAAANGGDDVGFGLAVDVGDEVVAALGVDFDGIEARQAAHDQITGAPGGAHADIEQWLHKGR
jgi:hypothetical protein